MYKRFNNILIKLHTILVRGKFKKRESFIHYRVDIDNPQYISIGKGVTLRPYTWLYAITSDTTGKVFTPELIINDGCSIGRFCHITCSKSVIFEKNVFLTEGVLVTDSIHGYRDITTPVYYQPLISKKGVRIGEGTWIGNGARIVGDVMIGKGCVISANTLLSNIEIPDYCVVMGIPGKIVKKYNPSTNVWENIV